MLGLLFSFCSLLVVGLPCTVLQEGGSEYEAVLGPYLPGSGFDKESLAQLHAAIEQLSRTGSLPTQQLQLAQQLAADLAGSSRKAWRAGDVAAAVLILLAAASGSSQQLLPAQAAAVVQSVGLEASATAVSRHRATAWRLWRVSSCLEMPASAPGCRLTGVDLGK